MMSADLSSCTFHNVKTAVFAPAWAVLGMRYWSLSAYLKVRVKNAVQFISDFEEAVVREAERCNVDGVICGHIHHAEMKTIGSIQYMNDGDWVESCTALVEHHDGRWEIINWADVVSGRREANNRLAASAQTS